MAALSGTAGTVTVAGTVVAEIAEWSLNLGMTPQETTAFADDWEAYVPSVRTATGSFSGNLDHADTTGQTEMHNHMLNGTSFAAKLHMDGTKYFNIAAAYVTGMNPSISQKGKGEISFDFQTSGAVTIV